MKLFVTELFSYIYLLVEHPSEEDYYTHIHSNFELFYFLRGDAQYSINGKIYKLKPHDLLLIPPTQYHSLQLKSNAPYERFTLHFSPYYMKDNFLKPISEFGMCFTIQKNSVIDNIFSSLMVNENIFSEKDMLTYINLCINSILLNLVYLEQKPTTDNSETTTIVKILLYINKNISRKISIDELCDKFFISKSWLNHQFKKQLNIPVIKYIKQKRITYAQTLLQKGIPPTKVSESCNYGTYSTFYRQYIQFMKKNPNMETPRKHD